MTSKEYLSFVKERLKSQMAQFEKLKHKKNIEKKFSGLYSLLRLG